MTVQELFGQLEARNVWLLSHLAGAFETLVVADSPDERAKWARLSS